MIFKHVLATLAATFFAVSSASAATILNGTFGPHPTLSSFGVSQSLTQFPLEIGTYEGMTADLPFEADYSVDNSDDGTGLTVNVPAETKLVFGFSRAPLQTSMFDLMVDAILPSGYDGGVQFFVADFGSTVEETLADLGADLSSPFSFIGDQIDARSSCTGVWSTGSCSINDGGGGTTAPVPVPIPGLLLVSGLVGLLAVRRRKMTAA